MTMQLFVLLLIGSVLAVYAGIALATWFRLRGTRVVTCPQTHKPAAVTVDLGHAAATAVLDTADVQLTTCSCWPEREGCDQACVPQIVEAQDETRARTIAAHFFEGARCAICQTRIEPPNPATLQPGLFDPATQEVAAWDEVPAEQLMDIFKARRAICPNCTLAESFRRRFPDRVVDRIPRPGSAARN
jgi:hypothetical protein